MVFKSWNRIFKADNVIQSLRPLTYLSYISLAPLGFNRNGKNNIYIPNYIFVIGFVYFVIACYICYICGSVETTITTSPAIIPIFGCAIIMRRKLVGVIQSIFNINKIYGHLGIRMKYKSILRYNFLTSTALAIFCSIFIIVQMKDKSDSWPDIFELTYDCIFHFNVIILAFKYVCLTHLVQSLFSLINEVLYDILEANTAMDIAPIDSVVIDTSVRQNPENAVKQISDMHDMLCDICETIEDYFAYPLAVVLGLSIYTFIISSYIVVVCLYNLDNESLDNGSNLIIFSTEVMWFIVIIVSIVEVSRRTVSQSSSSALIVHKILNKTDDLKLKDRLNTFSQQLTHRKVSFTAAGLVNLDRTLILTVSSAAGCYIIVLAQFYPEHFKAQTNSENNTNKTDYMHCQQIIDKLINDYIASNLTDLT